MVFLPVYYRGHAVFCLTSATQSRWVPWTLKSSMTAVVGDGTNGFASRGYKTSNTKTKTTTKAIPAQNRRQSVEESHIAAAVRKFQERKPMVVIEVINAFGSPAAMPRHGLWNPRTTRMGNEKTDETSIPLRVRILTRADLLSPAALRHQMYCASFSNNPPSIQPNYVRGGRSQQQQSQPQPDVAVVAVNLHDITESKLKEWNSLLEILAGASRQAEYTLQQQQQRTNETQQPQMQGMAPTSLVVCGLPNAGKSSLIYALTKHRTMAVKKKKAYHLPRISQVAGQTLGVKKHLVTIENKNSSSSKTTKTTLTLIDTPGIRPRIESISEWQLAYLLASGSIERAKGMLTTKNQDSNNGLQASSLPDKLVYLIWYGLRRHAEISGNHHNFAFATPEDLLEHARTAAGEKNSTDVYQYLIRQSQSGAYGGLIMDRILTIDHKNNNMLALDHANDRLPIQEDVIIPNYPISQKSRVVAMNDLARAFQRIGSNQVEPKSSTTFDETTHAPSRNDSLPSSSLTQVNPDTFAGTLPFMDHASTYQGGSKSPTPSQIISRPGESRDEINPAKKLDMVQQPNQHANGSLQVKSSTAASTFSPSLKQAKSHISGVRVSKSHPGSDHREKTTKGTKKPLEKPPDESPKSSRIKKSVPQETWEKMNGREKSLSTLEAAGTRFVHKHMIQNFRCLQCAGFIRIAASPERQGRGKLVYLGSSYSRVLPWGHKDIIAFYSRAAEAFGIHPFKVSHGLYLMRDSLARTFARKYKLSSRRKVYWKFGKDMGGFPLKDEDRPLRFRCHQPVPFRVLCTSRAASGCRMRRMEMSQKESKQQNKRN